MTAADRVHVLVTVSRSWSDWDQMEKVLAHFQSTHPGALLVHGGAKVGDCDAAEMWDKAGGQSRAIRARWSECGPECANKAKSHRKRKNGREWCSGAGHRRNRAMVDAGPQLFVAFVDPASVTAGAKETFRYGYHADLNWVLCRPFLPLVSWGDGIDPLPLLDDTSGVPAVRYNQETNR